MVVKWIFTFSSFTASMLYATATLAGAYADPIQNAAVWLESIQDSTDGSWLDTSESRTFLQTTEAVLALHQANRRSSAYYAGQTWIKNHDPRNLDARARRLVVLRTAQSSSQPDVDALLTAVSTPATGQSGWGLTKRYQASPLDTALALDALRQTNALFNSTQALAYLKSTQLSTAGDQGWPVGTGGTTDTFTTARVVQSLSGYKQADPSLTSPITNAINTLKTKVSVSSPPHIRAAAALAYLSVDPNSNDAKTLLNSLLALQRADGGFDAGVFTTGLIVQAFAAAEGKDNTNDREAVDVTDPNLRDAINQALGRASIAQLNRGELAQLTSLDISNREITSLNGLQYAVNLTTLIANNNQITDTSPISGLTNLANADLSGNPCTGCNNPVASNSADVPLPLWALVALGAGLMGVAGRAHRRQDHE
jgi:hypothetical protein